MTNVEIIAISSLGVSIALFFGLVFYFMSNEERKVQRLLKRATKKVKKEQKQKNKGAK